MVGSPFSPCRNIYMENLAITTSHDTNVKRSYWGKSISLWSDTLVPSCLPLYINWFPSVRRYSAGDPPEIFFSCPSVGSVLTSHHHHPLKIPLKMGSVALSSVVLSIPPKSDWALRKRTFEKGCLYPFLSSTLPSCTGCYYMAGTGGTGRCGIVSVIRTQSLNKISALFSEYFLGTFMLSIRDGSSPLSIRHPYPDIPVILCFPSHSLTINIRPEPKEIIHKL